jgi:hypothetical protein
MSEEIKNMSIAEFFKHKGMQEAIKVEVTYEDGTKVALDGQVALMWWRLIHIYWKDHPNMRHEGVYKFRPVDKDGILPPLTIPEMIEQHDWGTGFCSFAGHMRRASPTYKDIVALGEKALPAILEYLRDNHAGMNIVLLLEDIAKTSPYKPEAVAPGMVGYQVKDCAISWLEWGKQNNYIK